MSHILVIAPDSMGDHILRQPLYSSIIAAGHKLAIVHRGSAKEILEILVPEAKLIEPSFDVYKTVEETSTSAIKDLFEIISNWNPDTLIAPLKNTTWLECRIFEVSTAKHKISIQSKNVGPDNDVLSARRKRIKNASNRLINVNDAESEIQTTAALMVELGFISSTQPAPLPSIEKKHNLDVSHLLNTLGIKSGEFAFGNPAGITNIKIKAWPRSSMIDSLMHLKNNHNIKTLLVGVEQEFDYIHSIATETDSPIWIGGEKSIKTCMALMSHAKFYIGTDTGTMHLAAAMGLPVIALYGGGLWPRFLPQANRCEIITQKLPCTGCDWNCPFEKPPCIESVTQASVNNAIDRIIENAVNNTYHINLGSELSPLASSLFINSFNTIKKLSTERATAHKLSADIQHKLTNYEENNNTLKKSIDILESRLSDSNNKLAITNSTLTATTYESESIKSSLEKSNDDLKTKSELIRFLENKLSEYDKQLKNLTEEINKSAIKSTEINCALKSTEEKYINTSKCLKIALKKLIRAEEKNENTSNQLYEANNSLSKLEAEKNSQLAINRSLEIKLELALISLKEVEEKLAITKNELCNVIKSNTRLETNQAILAAHTKEIEEQFLECKNKLSTANILTSKLEQQIVDLQTNKNHLQKTIDELNAKENIYKATWENRPKICKYIEKVIK